MMFRAKKNELWVERLKWTFIIPVFICLLICVHLPFSWAAKDKIGLDPEWRPIKGIGKPPGPEKPPEPGAPCKTWREPVTGMAFVWVPGGCFEMGTPASEKGRGSDEGPVHKVCVDGFWMGQYEVTNAQFRRFRSGHDSKEYKGNTLNGDNQPAVYVSWNNAKAFADWLRQKNSGKYTFRLPSEAEWEYACRAGTKTARFWGDDPNEACGYANVHDRTSKQVNKFKWENHNCDDGYAVTATVGSFKANELCLNDMLGNVWEWSEDWYGKYSSGSQKNPKGPSGGSNRVIRGGSWYNLPRDVRCGRRSDDHPGNTNRNLGFRLVRTP